MVEVPGALAGRRAVPKVLGGKLNVVLRDIGGLWPLFVIITWVSLLPRVVPSLGSDRGIFVSVAERLLAGDRLYAEVFDNKEPFFYYFVALQRLIGPVAEPGAELLLLGIASLSAYVLASRLSDKKTAILVGFVVTPLLLTGRYYLPGYTHLPGAALCLAAYAFCVTRRISFAGVGVGAVLFTKVIMFPLALSLAISAIALRKSATDFWRLLIWITVTVMFISVALQLRGELGPFLETLSLNLAYANGALIKATTIWDSALAHLNRVSSVYFWVTLGDILICIFLTLTRGSLHERVVIETSLAAAMALVISLGVLATTGMWGHHAQILYVPAALAVIGLSSLVTTFNNQAALGW